jgi:hypothetical protein
MVPDDISEFTLEDFVNEYPNIFRECAERMMRGFYVAIERMPDSPQKWGVAFAVAAPITGGRSMTMVASDYGWSRALLSHEARSFCEATGWPMSSSMKSENAGDVARKARNKAVEAR